MGSASFKYASYLSRQRGIPTIFLQNVVTTMFIFITSLLLTSVSSQSDMSPENLSFGSLEACSDSSYTMSRFGPEDVLAPCILYDIRDFSHSNSDLSLELIDVDLEAIEGTSSNRTSEITLVQVTPSSCHNHRDGAATAVKLMNANHDGKGIPIGYNQDFYVKFRLISIVGGNINNVGDAAYKTAHSVLLDSVLNEVDNAHFILGSCSQQAVVDKSIALEREKVVISQVGPPGFYMDVSTNPYVFGIHVNSDTYPLPAIQALQFHLKTLRTSNSLQPVKVIYRNQSEFFKSTCQSAIAQASMQGFDVTEIEYDPNADDGSGVPNSSNDPFLENLADQLCTSMDRNSTEGVGIADNLPPAIFACVLNHEADVILNRIRSNGCRPSLSWFTTATWQWASDNPDAVPYFQGGGQWHKNFKYSDQFFESGQDVLDYGFQEYGYTGSYDHVVSYAIPNLIADLIQKFYRIDNFPNVADSFSTRYEDIRKALLYINAKTIFGPVSFNKYQRNSGRGGAGMQWIPASYTNISLEKNDTEEFVLGCMSPLDQADAAIIVPSPSGSSCSAGNFVNQTMIEVEPSLLRDKCSSCAINSYISEENDFLQCITCPMGSSTMGDVGATNCIKVDSNLIPIGLKSMGYLFVVISWSLSIGYLAWMVVNKNDSVIKIGQPEFLFFICVGAMISSSTIIPLTLAEADDGEDTSAASRNCQAIPFLYSIGWVLMYSSLTAKSYRLTMVAAAANSMSRVTVTAKRMYKIIVGFLVLDAIILITWQVVDPLMYVRTELTKSIDEETGIITIETVGHCSCDLLWNFLGPIIAIHVSLMIMTNVLLWRVRNISDRYQEQKFVALASIYICELLLLGVPILVAVQDSAAARYIVIAGVIFLTDTGVLSFIFIPKIKYQNEGLPEGVTVAQSMRNVSTAGEPRSRFSAYNISSRSTKDVTFRETSKKSISLDSVESNGEISVENGDLETKQTIPTITTVSDPDTTPNMRNSTRKSISTKSAELGVGDEESLQFEKLEMKGDNNADDNAKTRVIDNSDSGKSNSSRHNSSADLWSSQNHRQSATGASELLKLPKTSSMIVENSQIE